VTTQGGGFEYGSVRGLRIVITGAAGVFGRGLVADAARQGAAIVATGREPTIRSAEFTPGVRRIAADIADPGECRLLIQRAAEELGGLDVLVNNAAWLLNARIAELTESDLERAWAVNVRAPVILTQEAAKYMERSPSAAVVNVVSTAGFTGGVAPVSAYAMTKAALIVFTKSAAREFGPRGIRVLAVSPPTMESQMQGSLDADSRERVRSMSALGRVPTVDEAARVTLFAASPYAGAITGTVIDATATGT
jgi:NAD(P)-dependent dehydrogenase (short-subunit alcohol dehydrogenase family)